ncbi:uncharacterized protein LOC109845904 [Asparagus officinalis]|uniref:uncharacterized protein LOC109845904 n=1 Tax=Asparagus officinalis TaxID=4686 RepID=UPI00098E451B|nr:uncharacterized protein LOC109845904 [Asparagus officinalis]
MSDDENKRKAAELAAQKAAEAAKSTTSDHDSDHDDPDAEVIYRKLDPSSPYFLGSNDHSGNMICTVKLNGENYERWARSMRLSLRGKRKWGFVDGSIRKPVNPIYLVDWDAVQSTLVQWIMNSIENQKNSIPYFEEAKPLWDLLQRRFTVSNGQRQQELKYELAQCKQTATMSVASYFGKLEKLWDEIDNYNPVPACICGMSEEFQKKKDEAKFHDFLFGINQERYGNLAFSIIGARPVTNLGLGI